MAELAEQASGTADTARSEKRVRSILNYARTALRGPGGASRRDAADEFPWAGDDLVAEALMVCEENPATGATQEAWEKQQAWHAFERQVATLGEADALKWARQPGMWSFDVEAMIRHYEAEKAAGRMTDLKPRMRKLYPWMADTWREEAKPEPEQPDEPMSRAGFIPPA